MRRLAHHASAFGISWNADLPLTEFDGSNCDQDFFLLGRVDVRRVQSLRDRVPIRTVNRGLVYRDGVRVPWNDEVVFDMFDGERVDYLPERRWREALPSAFYSTVAALTAAWRGAVPLHASAVEVDGRAFLIAGASGAGKSSLAAGLIVLGAKLVADDLTVIRAVPGTGSFEVFPGRPDMRQHPWTAALMDTNASFPIAGDGRGKWLVRPVARTLALSVPLGGILLLESRGQSIDAAHRAALLGSHLFRPRWLAALPNHRSLRCGLLAITSAVPIRTFPPAAEFDPHVQARRAEEALAMLQTIAGS